MSQSKVEEALDEVLGYVVRVGDATSQLVNVAILLGDNANESDYSVAKRDYEVLLYHRV